MVKDPVCCFHEFGKAFVMKPPEEEHHFGITVRLISSPTSFSTCFLRLHFLNEAPDIQYNMVLVRKIQNGKMIKL